MWTQMWAVCLGCCCNIGCDLWAVVVTSDTFLSLDLFAVCVCVFCIYRHICLSFNIHSQVYEAKTVRNHFSSSTLSLHLFVYVHVYPHALSDYLSNGQGHQLGIRPHLCWEIDRYEFQQMERIFQWLHENILVLHGNRSWHLCKHLAVIISKKSSKLYKIL